MTCPAYTLYMEICKKFLSRVSNLFSEGAMLYKRLSILFDVLFHKNGTFWSQFPTHMEKFFWVHPVQAPQFWQGNETFSLYLPGCFWYFPWPQASLIAVRARKPLHIPPQFYRLGRAPEIAHQKIGPLLDEIEGIDINFSIVAALDKLPHLDEAALSFAFAQAQAMPDLFSYFPHTDWLLRLCGRKRLAKFISPFLREEGGTSIALAKSW